MATQITPIAGLTELALRAYVEGAAFTLVLYTNAANSLFAGMLAADLVQPPLANGYGPIVMNGQWTVVNGIATYIHTTGGDPTFSSSGSWGSDAIGAAMVFGAAVIHARDNTHPFTAAAGKKLAINISNLIGP